MEVESIRDKALRRFAETGNGKGLPSKLIDRLRNMLIYLSVVDEVDELKAPPNFGAHQLTGDRTGVWAMTVSRNWRMTFRIDEAGRIVDLDLEDHH